MPDMPGALRGGADPPSDLTAFTAALAGRYAIQREIGRGGMATVYLARDIRHDRPVALKLLNPELAAVLGLERFLAEIRVTANLQHPNLLPLFDSGEAAGLLFYVMPYVEGESLRARLERERQLPVDESVRLAATIASALDYAHRHHVVHRDLKPENILLHDGQPLIADFGIALAITNAGGTRITQTGLSLGTPQYMSPEQASGDRAVDGRSDIYSLAAVTYEMLAGEAPHLGNTVQAVVAKVLTEKPVTVRVRRNTVPEHVAAALDTALEKTPADRFASAQQFADALLGRAVETPGRARAVASTGGRRTWRSRAVREGAAWSLAALAVAALLWPAPDRDRAPDAPVVRALLDLPSGVRINETLSGATLAVSPAGDAIAFTTVNTGGFRLYIRRMDQLEPRAVTDQNIAARNLTFSPDGRWIAFTEGALVKKLAVDGGPPVLIGSVPKVPYGIAWAGADTLVIGSFERLYVLPASGGPSQALPSSGADGRRWPVIVPGGDAVVYVTGDNSTASGRLAVRRWRGRSEEVVFDLPAAVSLGFLHGQLVYVTSAGMLMAVPFDLGELRPAGEPKLLEEDVVVDGTAGAKASLSASGTLAFLRGRPDVHPVLFARNATTGTPLVREPNRYATPRFSPDGRSVAMTVSGEQGIQVLVYHIANNTRARLTSEGSNVRPEWTPDGERILYRSDRDGKDGSIWWQPADGNGPEELLFENDLDLFEAIVSPDNEWLVYRSGPGMKSPRDIMVTNLRGPRVSRTLVEGPNSETMPRISPDGRWLAYQSNAPGRFEIYVIPFPRGGARVQVSDRGGTEPLWDRSGRALYYRGPAGEIVAVSVTTGGTFAIGERKSVLTGDYLLDASHANYDVAPDGRFLMLRRAGAESQAIVVHNWGRELRERTRAQR